MIGGQQGNSLLELIKQGKLQKKAPAKKEEKAAAAAAAAVAAANATAAASRPVSAGPATSEVRNSGDYPPRFPCAMSTCPTQTGLPYFHRCMSTSAATLKPYCCLCTGPINIWSGWGCHTGRP